ncbi:hypothetical protein AEP_00049 [Curvibacter sp. AEP1-3]|jgi:hypothetical protein|uniref:FixH family protein n=1 Tax=Curvibacter sp. AEP1-3 TaxID=1844971 RepID=UPI000B3D39F0|nr:FixH family protein [Curvibacter sp. AEP1-3]ARV17015.1 hypothetical protein AEP_00049 [Curvibacter sp. AEP1-3]
MSNPTTSSNTPAPWWKFGHVWLVVSGPLIVVVASFLTFYIAVRGMDPIVDENYYQAGLDINKSLAAKPESLAPAMQARNHAATGVVPTTAPR